MDSNPDILNRENDQDFSQMHLTSIEEITWTVRNLTSMPKNAGYSLDSPPFVFQNATWCLRLFPNGTPKRLLDFSVGLAIVRLSSRVRRHKLLYRLMSKDNFKGVRYQVADFDEDHKETRDMENFSRYEVYESLVVPRGSIEVSCQISCCGSHAADVFSQTELSVQDAKAVGSLCEDLKNMLLNGQNHDLTLKVKDKEFRAHRDLLRARSSVFEAMLSHDMIEKISGVVDIGDCDPSAFEKFLVYLYGGPVDTLDSSTAPSLYSLAEKYDVAHLKQVCRDSMKESLTASNFTGVVEVALEHDDAGLLRCATDYFVREVDEILPTEEWLSFLKSNPDQANELFMKATEYTTDSKKMPRK